MQTLFLRSCKQFAYGILDSFGLRDGKFCNGLAFLRRFSENRRKGNASCIQAFVFCREFFKTGCDVRLKIPLADDQGGWNAEMTAQTSQTFKILKCCRRRADNQNGEMRSGYGGYGSGTIF